MSAPKHTPGPWIVSFDAPGSASLVVRRACRPSVDPDRVAWIPNRREKEANAALIAAAPEMLAVLECLYGDLVSLAFFDAGNYESHRDEIKAVIAKARAVSVTVVDAEPQCCICGGPIAQVKEWRDGHNAQPVAEGRCCGHCNKNHVVPARVREMMSRYTGGE